VNQSKYKQTYNCINPQNQKSQLQQTNIAQRKPMESEQVPINTYLRHESFVGK